MSGLMPARERARLLRREIAHLLDDAQNGRNDLLGNAERIRRVAEELCEVEEQLADDELVAP
jgi:hypothetical protein